MQLKFTHDIDNNIFSTVITIDSFGTEQFSEDEERELLNDFPSKIAYRNMVFSKNVKMNGTVPEVTTEEPATAEGEEATAATVVKVTIPVMYITQPRVCRKLHKCLQHQPCHLKTHQLFIII